MLGQSKSNVPVSVVAFIALLGLGVHDALLSNANKKQIPVARSFHKFAEEEDASREPVIRGQCKQTQVPMFSLISVCDGDYRINPKALWNMGNMSWNLQKVIKVALRGRWRD